MENSGEVTIEGENYEVVDECTEEEDIAQFKSLKNTDVEQEAAMDATNIATTELNNSIEQNEAIRIKKNDDITIEKIDETNTDKNNITIIEKHDAMIAEKIEDINVEKNEDIKIQKNHDTNMNKSNNTNIEKNDDIKVEKNNDTNAENNINVGNDKDTNMKNVIINIKDDKEALIEYSIANTFLNNKKSDNVKENRSAIEQECSQQLNTESIDVNVNINCDQLDHQKDMDENALYHLDDIENIVLDSVDFQVQEENQSIEESIKNQSSNSESNKSVEKTKTNENLGNRTLSDINKDLEVQLKADKSSKNDWYEKKFIQKEIIIKERLTKVARVLGISYPCYEKWLEYQEKINGSPLCTLKPSRRCCLDKPYTNRWKFICNKKKIYDPITKMDSCDAFFNKTTNVIWKLEASNVWGVNPNNKSEFPPFVLHAVKIFEDFLQTTEELNSQNSVSENFSDDVSIEIETKTETNNEDRQDWLWLVVRCNSMDELMLFATGENISRTTMDRLKQVYESGAGKDCNVKSLYCKSTNKYNDITVTDTTFLVGSEALDEIVGGLKVQLAPKTNFWSNAAGAENVANAVMDFLAPTPKITVLEIGCGIGLIGLMMASKCQQVIGVDSPSEVEEAELTCELNNIKNASFVMGSPTEVTSKIIAAVKNRKTYAVVNANTNIGRAIEVMTCLRQIPSLEQIVMITTLTKQSVRAILELVRPGIYTHGSVFIPVSACVVDTLPIGPNFEAVILLQRKMMNKLNKPWLLKHIDENVKNSATKYNQEKLNEQNIPETDKKMANKATDLESKKYLNKSLKKAPKKSKILMKKTLHSKNVNNSFTKNKFKGKRAHSPDKGDAPPKKLMKKFNKFGVKPWHTDATTKKKKEWNTENPQLRFNPLYEKKMREHKEQTDLRKRLSNNRLDTDIAQTVKKHQALLEMAKEKLSGPSPTVDVNTAKQLQSMLNMVLEQTNKLQSQLPRSVWDRIAPPENVNTTERVNKQDDALLKGRYIQEIGSQDIVITAPNKEFVNNEESVTKPIYKKYSNLLPLEPNTIMPAAQPSNYKEERSVRMIPERFHETKIHQQQIQENSWNRNKTFERNRWNEIGNIKKSMSPVRRQNSPPNYCMASAKRPSPSKRPLLTPPRRLCSPPRRHFSPLRHPMSSMYRQRSPVRRQMSPLRTMPPRRMSPSRRSSSPRRLSPLRRGEMTMNRPVSPISSPIELSPKRSIVSPSRRQASPMERPMSPLRREIPSPNTQEIMLSRRQMITQERQQTSMPRRQQSPPRKQIWPQKFTDNWDIPSRRAIEQNTWTRPVEQNMWRTEKTLSNNGGEQITSNDRRRKTLSQEKWDNVKISIDNDAWDNSGNTWNSKQMSTNPMMKETWPSSSNNRWLATSNMPGNSKDNWNIRGKESFTAGKEPWVENKQQARWESTKLNFKDTWKQSEKEELNDLPEDAKDPWGDDGISDLKERWLKFESTSASSTWMRQNEQQGDSWTKHKDNWQSKGVPYGTKSQWQNNGIGESRWLSQNEVEKKASSSGWQNGNTIGSWQFQHSNFQSQRPFSGTQFKDL